MLWGKTDDVKWKTCIAEMFMCFGIFSEFLVGPKKKTGTGKGATKTFQKC